MESPNSNKKIAANGGSEMSSFDDEKDVAEDDLCNDASEEDIADDDRRQMKKVIVNLLVSSQWKYSPPEIDQMVTLLAATYSLEGLKAELDKISASKPPAYDPDLAHKAPKIVAKIGRDFERSPLVLQMLGIVPFAAPNSSKERVFVSSRRQNNSSYQVPVYFDNNHKPPPPPGKPTAEERAKAMAMEYGHTHEVKDQVCYDENGRPVKCKLFVPKERVPASITVQEFPEVALENGEDDFLDEHVVQEDTASYWTCLYRFLKSKW